MGDEIQTEQSRKNNHLTTKRWCEYVALFLNPVLLLETGEVQAAISKYFQVSLFLGKYLPRLISNQMAIIWK